MSHSPSVASSPGTPASPSLLADLKAGFFVFLIALPLCLAIAQASQFPPIAGVMTAIVGGLLVTPLGSARLTIKGPAAGLIVIVCGAVTELGTVNGVFDPALGYHRTLAVGMVAAAMQIGFGLLRFASAGAAIAPSVVHGMMAAIGITIAAKQFHVALGVTPIGKKPLDLIAEIPGSFGHANPAVLMIGITSIVILILWPFWKTVAKKVPAPIVVLVVGVLLGWVDHLADDHRHTLLGLEYTGDKHFLVELPASLWSAIVFPNFDGVWSGASLKWVVMFALIGFIESTLSTLAVDALDPAKRASDLNKDLVAVGCGNLVSAAIGGLPMISEIVRSKANIDAGAQSSKANFVHGLLLLLSILTVPWLLQMIPQAALAAMLIMVGWRLGGPATWRHAWHTGWDQFLLFTVTIGVTLLTDLLKGVAAGLLVKFVLHMLRGVKLSHFFSTEIRSFKNGDELRITLHGSAVGTTLLRMRREFDLVDPSVLRVVVDLTDCALVDHTFLSSVKGIADEFPKAKLQLVFADAMQAASFDPQATRWKR